MKNIKDLFNFIKELWGNKRYRSLAILICYIIFFMIIIIPLRGNIKNIDLDNKNNSDNNINEGNLLVKYSEFKDYEAFISINNQLVLKEVSNNNQLTYSVISDLTNTYSVDEVLYDQINNKFLKLYQYIGSISSTRKR